MCPFFFQAKKEEKTASEDEEEEMADFQPCSALLGSCKLF